MGVITSEYLHGAIDMDGNVRWSSPPDGQPLGELYRGSLGI
jgi:hypothetical protein